jgi:hypothetical protein
MDEISSIKKSIQNIVLSGELKMPVFAAKVKAVDDTTCTVELDGLELKGVRLRAVINSEEEQLLITPKKDSYVLVVDLSAGKLSDLAVLTYSEVESCKVRQKYKF